MVAYLSAPLVKNLTLSYLQLNVGIEAEVTAGAEDSTAAFMTFSPQRSSS